MIARFAALLLLAALPAAETPVPVEDAAAVERLFAAGDPASTAWAAWHAARLRLAGAVPNLVAHLGDGAGQGWRMPERVAARACAAALADLRAPVDAGVPERIRQAGCEAEALVVAAADALRHRDWLATLLAEPQTPSLAWLAAGNLLAGTREAQALAAIHGGLAPVLVAVVRNPRTRVGIGRRSASHRCGDGLRLRRPGFPPLVTWTLRDRDREGAVVLADGPTPILVLRHEQTAEQEGCGSVDSPPDRGAYRARLLRAALGGDGPAPPHREEADLEYEDPAWLLAELAWLAGGRQARWDALTGALLTAGLLPPGTPPPRLALAIVDRRSPPARDAGADPDGP